MEYIANVFFLLLNYSNQYQKILHCILYLGSFAGLENTCARAG